MEHGGGVERGGGAWQVPIHETNAVLQAWAEAPVASPDGRRRRERGKEKEREVR